MPRGRIETWSTPSVCLPLFTLSGATVASPAVGWRRHTSGATAGSRERVPSSKLKVHCSIYRHRVEFVAARWRHSVNAADAATLEDNLITIISESIFRREGGVNQPLVMGEYPCVGLRQYSGVGQTAGPWLPRGIKQRRQTQRRVIEPQVRDAASVFSFG